MRAVLLIITLLIIYCGNSQTTIHCHAPAFKNQVATLLTYDDYFSMELRELDQQTIDENGDVSLSTTITRGIKTVIQIHNKKGILYLDPNTDVYTIDFPKATNDAIKFTNNVTQLIFDSLPRNDLNTLILEYNLLQDNFLYGDEVKMQRTMAQSAEFRDSLDQFTQLISFRYGDIKSTYFKNYVLYSLASIALHCNRQEPDKNGFMIFESFIKNKPILYHNDAYMAFINDFYTDFLSDLSMTKRDEIMAAINSHNNLDSLSKSVKKNYYFRNDVLLELLLIKGLGEAYHTTYFNRASIRSLLQAISDSTTSTRHEKIASNVLTLLTKMVEGFEAPDFSLVSIKGDTISLELLKGKYIYLSFWASWNAPSVKDLLILRSLHEKYGQYVTFVSISLDEKKADYMAFMQEHQDIPWTVGHYNGNVSMLNDFDIRSIPYYLFIDPKGLLEQSPAYSPSPDGTGKSIDETLHYIKKRLEPRSNIRVGKQ